MLVLAMAHFVVREAEDPEGAAASLWDPGRCTRRLLCPAKPVIKASGAQELL